MNARLVADAARIVSSSEIARTPGYPLTIPLVLNLLKNERSVTHTTVGDIRWTVVTDIIEEESDMNFLRVTVICTAPKGRILRGHLKLVTDFAIMNRGSVEKIVFSDSTRCLIWNNRYRYVKMGHFGDLQASSDPSTRITVTIENIEVLQSFEWHNQIWPSSTRWMNGTMDNGSVCSMRIDISSLLKMNPKFLLVEKGVPTGRAKGAEVTALYEFLGLCSNLWYFGTPKFEEVLRNGYKMEFTENWKEWDAGKKLMPFQIRTLLPLYQHTATTAFKSSLKTIPEQEFRTHTCAHDFAVDLEDPYLNYLIVPIRESYFVPCQFTLYFEKTDRHHLLMAGVNYEIDDDNKFEVKARVALVKDDQVYLLGEGSRMICKNQRSLGIVIGVLDDNLIKMLNSKKMSVVIQSSQRETNEDVIHNYVNCWSPVKEEYEKVLSMPGPHDDSKWLEENSKTRATNGDEPLYKCPSGWLICRDGRIGVSTEFLASKSDYLDMRFFNTSFKDCNLLEVKIDEDVTVVLAALNILWHRSEMLDLNIMDRLLSLADGWLCPSIKNYVELALMKTPNLCEADKIELGRKNDFELINYTMGFHPCDSSTYDSAIDPRTGRLIHIPKDNKFNSNGQPIESDNNGGGDNNQPGPSGIDRNSTFGDDGNPMVGEPIEDGEYHDDSRKRPAIGNEDGPSRSDDGAGSSSTAPKRNKE